MSETEPQFKGPAIAVVVPVHNGAAFLQQCLASLAAQTFGDFACFVVDDGSTDESAELAAAWESRDARFVVIHQRQSGVAAARAAGVRAGLNLNARWFAFCDADDCYHKQFLDALYRAAQTTRCQIACCRYDCFTEDIPPESPPPSQTTVFQPPAHLDALLHDHRVDFGLWNKLYAHELITAEIMDNGLAYNEDLVANWQIFSAADGCAYVDFAGYHYRQHAASASHRALPPESIDQQRQAAVFIREHASPAIQQSANAFYYGNPQNRFWRVMAACLGVPVPPNEGDPLASGEPATLDASIAAKRSMLLSGGVAVWDVIESCDIKGSSDASIRNVVPAHIERITDAASIEVVVCNGGTAGRLYKRYLQDRTGLPAIVLPSTSPANAAWRLERLVERWHEAVDWAVI